jgi:ligand-binding SRPBCC domain-containing protein
MIREIYRVQNLGVEERECWDFFSDPGRLAEITPPWLNFSLVRKDLEWMYPGQIIEYRLTPFPGIAVSWITEITHVREPRYFVDEQRAGPYRLWHHEHHFRPTDTGMEMTDRVSYLPLLDLPGRPLDRIIAGRLKAIFDFRRDRLAEIFG